MDIENLNLEESAESNEASKKPRLSELSVELLRELRALLFKEIELFYIEIHEKVQSSSLLFVLVIAFGGMGVLAIQLLVVALILTLSKIFEVDVTVGFAIGGLACLLLSVIAAKWFLVKLKDFATINLSSAHSFSPKILKKELPWTSENNNSGATLIESPNPSH